MLGLRFSLWHSKSITYLLSLVCVSRCLLVYLKIVVLTINLRCIHLNNKFKSPKVAKNIVNVQAGPQPETASPPS